MRALIRKELREHRWALLALLVLVALAEALMLGGASMNGSPMVAFQKLVAFMAPLTALVLTNRLVVREYMGRTQLFLETLPVSRSQVLALKWLLGAALLLLAMAACFGVTLAVARHKVLLTPHYAALVAARAAGFLFFMYALAFAIGLTGRYRYIVWSVLIGAIFLADVGGQVAVSQWAPFHLVQESMVYERSRLPLADLLTTCAIAVALIGATFALALAAEGSLVVALSRRMSVREASAVLIALLVLILLLSVIERRQQKPPFALAQAVRSQQGPAVAVGIAGPPADAGLANELANLLSSDLARMQSWLALPSPPALTALPDDALDGDVFQRAALPNADGVVVRAAFTSPQFDREGFRAYALAAWLQWYGRGSSAQEDRRWLLDGAAQWLVANDLPRQQDLLALRAAFAARLLQAHRHDAAFVLDRWLSVREELGDCLADALAWRMVSSLAQQMGEPRFQNLARSVLAVRPADDARALFDPAMETLLAVADAPDRAGLAAQYGRLFDAEQRRLAATLDQIAIAPVRFWAQPMQGRAFEVHYQAGSGEVAPYSVRYVTLGPWDAAIPAEVLARVDTTRAGVLPASFARGTRLFTTVERREALLGCSVRLAAQRWELR